MWTLKQATNVVGICKALRLKNLRILQVLGQDIGVLFDLKILDNVVAVRNYLLYDVLCRRISHFFPRKLRLSIFRNLGFSPLSLSLSLSLYFQINRRNRIDITSADYKGEQICCL